LVESFDDYRLPAFFHFINIKNKIKNEILERGKSYKVLQQINERSGRIIEKEQKNMEKHFIPGPE